jgi:ABC-2 type transport system ATP-binding protein
MALVGSPELLILDEPTAGLDPNAARELRSIVREERDRGAAVFFSSHLLGQVEAVCDRVGILRDGALVAEDSIEGLRETRDTDTTLRISIGAASAAALDAVRDVGGVSDVSRTNGSLTVVCRSGAKMDVLGALEASSIAVEDFTTEETSLTELFARYTEEPA